METADDPDVRRRQRIIFILDSRAQGKTYSSISKQLGISKEYALYLGEKAKRDFYRKINPPRYGKTSSPMYAYEAYVVHKLKDFLLEIAE